MKRKVAMTAIAAVPIVVALALAPQVSAGARGPGAGVKVYTATLTPLNAGTHDIKGRTLVLPAATGNATITLRGDVVTVHIAMEGVTAGDIHPQHIHAGPRCPGPSADVNHDGFLDVIEGLPDYGPILVNLDSDLSSNPAGTFPVADGSGVNETSSYAYSATGSRSHIQDEIQTALKLGTRHVVIHGIDLSSGLPDTVATLGDLPNELTLPVACGELTQQ